MIKTEQQCAQTSYIMSKSMCFFFLVLNIKPLIMIYARLSPALPLVTIPDSGIIVQPLAN